MSQRQRSRAQPQRGPQTSTRRSSTKERWTGAILMRMPRMWHALRRALALSQSTTGCGSSPPRCRPNILYLLMGTPKNKALILGHPTPIFLQGFRKWRKCLLRWRPCTLNPKPQTPKPLIPEPETLLSPELDPVYYHHRRFAEVILSIKCCLGFRLEILKFRS